MGFHLVDAVYFNVVGTSSTAQAVLAYLAHRADDKGARKCYPSVESIEAATHFKHSSIHNALNELRERELLQWKSGGRLKGEGGKALANEYTFHLPSVPAQSIVRQADNAVSAKRIKHTPPDGQCIVRQTGTITQGHPKSHPSVITGPEAATDDIKREYEKVAESWDARKARVEAQAEATREERKHYLYEVVEEAMKACGVDDKENRRIFSSTLCRWNVFDDALEIIWRFGSEMCAHEHVKLRNPAAMLNKLLAAATR